MYVCVCNSVTDREIRRAVERGCDSMAKLRNELQVATCCGKCEACAREMLRECLSESAWSPKLAAATP